MPRPSSSTVTEPSTLIETLTVVAWPAIASSIELSTDFEDEMVQAAGRGVADVHGGPLADVLEIAEVLEIGGGVILAAARRGLLFGLVVFVFVGHINRFCPCVLY